MAKSGSCSKASKYRPKACCCHKDSHTQCVSRAKHKRLYTSLKISKCKIPRHRTAVRIWSLCSGSTEGGKDSQEVVFARFINLINTSITPCPPQRGRGGGRGVTKVAERTVTCTWQLESTRGLRIYADVSNSFSIISPTWSTWYLMYFSGFLVKGTLPYLQRKTSRRWQATETQQKTQQKTLLHTERGCSHLYPSSAG